jgi:hypothetical protein
MKASELIEVLQLMVALQGDREVFVHTEGCYFETKEVYAAPMRGETAFWIDEYPQRKLR